MNTKAIKQSLINFDQMPDSSNIRPKEASLILGVSLPTFWRLVKRGELKTRKLTTRTTTVNVGEFRAFIASK